MLGDNWRIRKGTKGFDDNLIALINLYDPIISFNNNRTLDANIWGNQVPIFKVLLKQNAKLLFHMSLRTLNDTNVFYTISQIDITNKPWIRFHFAISSLLNFVIVVEGVVFAQFTSIPFSWTMYPLTNQR